MRSSVFETSLDPATTNNGREEGREEKSSWQVQKQSQEKEKGFSWQFLWKIWSKHMTKIGYKLHAQKKGYISSASDKDYGAGMQ